MKDDAAERRRGEREKSRSARLSCNPMETGIFFFWQYLGLPRASPSVLSYVHT